MNPRDLFEKLEKKTIVMLENGISNKGFAIADIQRVDMMDSKWTYKKRMKS